jgi:uncharacterized protein
MTAPSFLFLDANLIMYALGGLHPLRDPSKKILEKIKLGILQVFTNTEVLQEILYRYFSIRKNTFGEMAYIAVVNLCQAVLPVTLQDTDRALDLLKQYPQITSRDAIHAATMLNNGIKEILSANSHFDLIPGIRRIDPGGKVHIPEQTKGNLHKPVPEDLQETACGFLKGGFSLTDDLLKEHLKEQKPKKTPRSR